MKRMMMLVTATALAVGVSGCAPKKTRIAKIEEAGRKPVHVLRDEDGVYYIASDNKVKNYGTDGFSEFAKAVAVARKIGKENGYVCFGIVNEGMNNLAGFPINDMRNMRKYFSLYGKANYSPNIVGKGSRPRYLFHNHHLKLRVVYFKEELPGLFLWRVQG